MRVHVIDTDSEQIEVKGPAQLTDLITLLSEANMSTHRNLAPDQLSDLEGLVHCYWIPAGGYTKAPELRQLGDVTVIAEDVE